MYDGLHETKNSQTSPSRFLRLPREIRDQIYKYTLDFAGQRAPKIRTMVAKNPTIGLEGTSEGIVYDYRCNSRTPLISSAGLLGTNHQIADEMGEIIMRRNKTTVEGVQYNYTWRPDINPCCQPGYPSLLHGSM